MNKNIFKVIYLVSGLSILFSITFAFVVLQSCPTFVNEGLAKGVLTKFNRGTKASSQFQYTFKLDRDYIGWTEIYGPLEIGDTIDVIYNRSDSFRAYKGGWDDSPPSYSAGSRYYHIIGNFD